MNVSASGVKPAETPQPRLLWAHKAVVWGIGKLRNSTITCLFVLMIKPFAFLGKNIPAKHTLGRLCTAIFLTLDNQVHIPFWSLGA